MKENGENDGEGKIRKISQKHRIYVPKWMNPKNPQKMAKKKKDQNPEDQKKTLKASAV